MTAGTRFRCLATLLAVAGLSAPVRSQPPMPEDPGAVVVDPDALARLTVGVGGGPAGAWGVLCLLEAGAQPPLQVWSLQGPLSTPTGRAQLGAGTLVLGGAGPGDRVLVELALLRACDQLDCWTLVNTDEVRPLPPALLERVQDERGIPGLRENDLELDAYFEFLVRASQTSAAAFEKAARHDLSYAHLFEEPAKYRGQVVSVSGRLKRLRRFDAPPLPPLFADRVPGIDNLYEGWIFAEALGANPTCVLFTDLPPGVPVRDKIDDLHVSFAGYFYKKYRYKAADSVRPNQRRDAPLLIGRTLRVTPGPAPAAESGEWTGSLLSLFLGLVACTLAAVVGLTWWFRHSDARARQRLYAARARAFVEPAGGRSEPEA